MSHYPPPPPPQGQPPHRAAQPYPSHPGQAQGAPPGQQSYGHDNQYPPPPGAAQPYYQDGGNPPLSRELMIALCCIGFFAVAGIHRFVSGHILLGVLYVFTGGFCLIGTIIDLVMIIQGSYRDNKGRPLRGGTW